MTFIKIQNVVINTNYIAAVRFNNQTDSEKKSVSVLVAIPKPPLFEWETVSSSHYQEEWMEFTGLPAKALEDYFSSFNNVVDLLPQCQETSLI
ncbi:hypothetical protein [Rivularia sp. UHCC 0363]|uniref:hypothetical protein n=1 Tax=Rivularia sp. UHCC 0363 TaxID=3110244 RepID=UPI002B217A86|nr:hypothetical protein [Rivularia sp. UHCC 0363]MEA5595653.1 hypothetical protein [Rivularia sp. UHCC 0363]